MIDLRSDTVTKPSKEMLEAMMNARVGDDVYEEDPTINKLQEMCALLTGKEAALFAPTGVMANQLGIKAHTLAGDEVIVESESHILNYETAAPSVISGVQLLPVKGEFGIMKASEIEKYIRIDEYHFPRTRLICIENTHNRSGGVIQPIEEIESISKLARGKDIKLHLDGARIFNASVETGITVKKYAGFFDSVSFCFSKGLGAPVGSILCGDKKLIEIARKWRKMLGGGMRQAGILGAAAIYALKNNVERMKEDHDKAKYFSQELSKMPGLIVDLFTVQTNIVIFRAEEEDKDKFIEKLRKKGVLISSGSYDNMRAVFHLDVSMQDVEKAVEAIRSVS